MGVLITNKKTNIMKTFKSNNELLNRNNVSEIKTELFLNIGEFDLGRNTLLELIKTCSNDFTKDIAEKFLENENWELSEKQAWCLSYQIKNNIEVYKKAMVDYSEMCEEEKTEKNINKKDEENEENEKIAKDSIEKFRIMIEKQDEIIKKHGFYFDLCEDQEDELIFINPKENDTDFEKFAKFIIEKTKVNVSFDKIKELYEMQQEGYKCYIKVDDNHYLYCPILANGFSIRLCVGKQETLKA